MIRIRSPFHILCKPIGPKCNLNCQYCFYLHKDQLFPEKKVVIEYRMSDDVLEQFIRQYIQYQHPLAPEVNFAWQGGEPTLLGVEFFRRVVEIQKKYARPDQKITNAFQTNGILLNDEWGTFLRENHFLVGLSIDGPEDLHDAYRRDGGGRGSFRRVMRGLEVLKRHQVEFNTLTSVHRKNGDYGREVYRFLREIGSTFMQFIPIVEPMPDQPDQASPETILPEQWGSFLCDVFDEWCQRDIGKVYVQHFELMISMMLGYPATLCVHAPTCGRSLALEHNGNLYSCDHFVTPHHYLGNLLDQSLPELIESPFQIQFGKDKSEKLTRQCRECRYLQFCYGGCPSDRIKRDRYGEWGHNFICEGYYHFYATTEPYFRAMALALSHRRPAFEYSLFLPMINQDQIPGFARRQTSFSHLPPKVGRNEPCPCGSGRKFKHCCGRKK